MERMVDILEREFGQRTTVRAQHGDDVAGACGQLYVKREAGRRGDEGSVGLLPDFRRPLWTERAERMRVPRFSHRDRRLSHAPRVVS